MPIYPVIYYNAIVASAMDPFRAILLTGNNRWKKKQKLPSWNKEQVVQSNAATSAMHTRHRLLLDSLLLLIDGWLCRKSVGSELQEKEILQL